MTDTQVLAAVVKLSGEPSDRWLGYRRTLDGANVVKANGQKFSYTHDQLRLALQLTLDEALQNAKPARAARWSKNR